MVVASQGTDLGSAVALQNSMESAELSRELTSGTQAEGFTILMGFICCTRCSLEGAGAGHVRMGDVLVLRMVALVMLVVGLVTS